MNVEMIEGVRTLSVDMIATTAVAGVMLMLGYFIKAKVSIFDRLCIPAPVIGGSIIACLVWVLKSTNTLNVTMDTTLQLPFMLAFFTCVGFGGSFKLLKKGVDC